MLYDGMIKFMKLAKNAAEAGDIAERFNNTEKASKIVTALQASLDHEAGPEISQILDSYYTQIYIKMMQFNINEEIEICDEIIDDLQKLRDSWKEVDEK